MSDEVKENEKKKIRNLSDLDGEFVRKVKEKYQLIKKNVVPIVLVQQLLKKKFQKLN